MNSDDDILQFYATQACCKLLDRKEDPPIKAMISKGIIGRCIEFLSFHHNSVLQFEALRILDKLTSGPGAQRMMVVNIGVIPHLVALLKSPANRVTEHVVLVLGNITATGQKACDQALKKNCLPQLLELIGPDTSASFIKNILCASANLYKMGSPSHLLKTEPMALPIFIQMLSTHDSQITKNAIRSLLHLIHRSSDSFGIQHLLDTGAVPHIVTLIASSDMGIVHWAMAIVVLMTRWYGTSFDAIINAGGLERLHALLTHEDPKMVAQATTAFSYLTGGTREQIQRFIDAGILPSLCNLLDKVIKEYIGLFFIDFNDSD